jgi:hypothetical protein
VAHLVAVGACRQPAAIGRHRHALHRTAGVQCLDVFAIRDGPDVKVA